MSIEKTAALVSRAVGVGLVIIGVSSVLSWSPPLYIPTGMVSSGWTSYQPPPTSTDPLAGVRQAISWINTTTWFYLPSIAQTVAGVFMLVCSRSVGRWLAKGLSDGDKAD